MKVDWKVLITWQKYWLTLRYGKDGKSYKSGYDCAIIPGGVRTNPNGDNREEFCGGEFPSGKISSEF